MGGNAKIVSTLLVLEYSCLLQHGIFAQFFLSTDPRLEKALERGTRPRKIKIFLLPAIYDAVYIVARCLIILFESVL